jgi:hypothetical protein
VNVASQTLYYLPLTGADLTYLLDTLQGRASLPLPNERDLARSLRSIEQVLPESQVEQVQETVKAGFEQARSQAADLKDHAVALCKLINEAQKRPSEFSL